jgi:hypothetical protein
VGGFQQKGRSTAIPERSKTMGNAQPTLTLVLRAVGLAMGVASVVLTVLNIPAPVTMLLSIGLLAVALASFTESEG